ncbi:teichoic acid biosynthesis protein C [Actinocorallia aurantiaca]|uniref:P68 RBP/TagC-like beta-propeller domain-containing protein n=1 Tax=Actinocorallia aurantiaca TaxID=46204 RepID=A0ABN3UU32_9ACTN
MSFDSLLSRRALLLGAAGSGALLLPGPAQADVPASKRFDLTTPSPTLLWRKPLRSGSWIMQSFGWDNAKQEIYFAQVKAGSKTGDLIITRTTATGRQLGWMVLRGFGHGVSIGVERYKGAVYLWTESKANPKSGFGTRVARFKFVNGKTIKPTSAGVLDRTPKLPNLKKNPQPAIDPVHNRLLVRFRDGSSRPRVAVFSLADARAGRLGPANVLAEQALPDHPASSPNQGFTGLGQYAYLISGAQSKDDTLLHWVDLRSGRRGKFLTHAGKSLLKDKREPEGIAVQVVSGRPRLTFGFSSGSSPNRRSSLFYKSTLK